MGIVYSLPPPANASASFRPFALQDLKDIGRTAMQLFSRTFYASACPQRSTNDFKGYV